MQPLAAPSARKQHALSLFAGLPRHYDAMGAVLSFGQDPRYGGARWSTSSTSARRLASSTSRPAGRYLEFYERLIENAGPFPPGLSNVDQAIGDDPVPAAFPPPSALTNRPTVIVTGHSPTEMRVQRKETQEAAA
jgi:hypothetical protein